MAQALNKTNVYDQSESANAANGIQTVSRYLMPVVRLACKSWHVLLHVLLASNMPLVRSGPGFSDCRRKVVELGHHSVTELTPAGLGANGGYGWLVSASGITEVINSVAKFQK